MVVFPTPKSPAIATRTVPSMTSLAGTVEDVEAAPPEVARPATAAVDVAVAVVSVFACDMTAAIGQPGTSLRVSSTTSSGHEGRSLPMPPATETHRRHHSMPSLRISAYGHQSACSNAHSHQQVSLRLQHRCCPCQRLLSRCRHDHHQRLRQTTISHHL